MSDPLAQARLLLSSAANFRPGRRRPVVALVRFKGLEAVVTMTDRRELDALRRLLKHLSAKLTVRELETVSLSAAKDLAWRELGHLSGYEARRLVRAHPEVFDAIAECNG